MTTISSLQHCSVSTISKIRDSSFPNSSFLLQKAAGELWLAFKRRILHFQKGQTSLIHTNTNKLTSCKVTDQILLSTIGVKTVKTGYKIIFNTNKDSQKKKCCWFFSGFLVLSFKEDILQLPSHTGRKESGKFESSRQASAQEDWKGELHPPSAPFQPAPRSNSWQD